MMDGVPDNHENLQDHFFFLARNLLSIYSGPLFSFSSQQKILHRMQRRLHSSMTLEVKPNGYGASFQAHMPAEGKDNLLTDNLKMTFPRVSHAYILLQIWPNSSEPRAETGKAPRK